MKKIFLIFILIFCFAVNSFAGIDEIGGFAYTPIVRTYTNTGGTDTDRVVWQPASGKKITLLGIVFNSDTATQFLVETGSTAIVPTTHATASGIVTIGNATPIWKGSADNTLTLTVNTSSAYSIMLWGYESN